MLVENNTGIGTQRCSPVVLNITRFLLHCSSAKSGSRSQLQRRGGVSVGLATDLQQPTVRVSSCMRVCEITPTRPKSRPLLAALLRILKQEMTRAKQANDKKRHVDAG